MSISFNYVTTGIFKEEIKNRFRARIVVDGSDEVCYIESSSRLDNYISLRNRTVLLDDVLCGKHLKHKVLAIKWRSDYILLCPMIANRIVYSELNRRVFSYLGRRKDAILEHSIEGYKSDIFIPETKTIVEIKAVLSTKNETAFPTVYSDRTISQLTKMEMLLDRGYKISYILASLNPYTTCIRINKSTEFYNRIEQCIKKGMALKAYSITNKDNETKIKKEISIVFD